jgi:hypothetical protein
VARTKKNAISKRSSSKRGKSRESEKLAPILKRPDGYYWEHEKGELRGPFVTREEAEADRLAGGEAEEAYEPIETLHEAESEIGVAEWIDPDTGVPAEDHVPRIEDH